MLKQTTRIANYDHLKGLFILLMILYHVLMSLFLGPDSYKHYLGFVTFAFIFISGMMVGETSRNTLKRKSLLRNFIKLLSLFISLNSLKWIYQGVAFDFVGIFIIGNTAVSSFDILLPISILFFSLIIFKTFIKDNHYIILIFTSILFVIEVFYLSSYNLALVFSGLVGYLFGKKWAIADLQLKFKFNSNLVIGIVLIFVFGSLAVIHSYVTVSLVDVLQTITAIFLAQTFLPLNKYLNFIGRNSLFIYILQIIILKIVSIFYQY